jgi:hypothetical protein
MKSALSEWAGPLLVTAMIAAFVITVALIMQ